MPKVRSKRITAKKRPTRRDGSIAAARHIPVVKLHHDEDELHLRMPAGKPEKRSAGEAEQAGCYVYGIIAANPSLPLGKTSVGGSISDVFAVEHQAVAAIASRVKNAILDATRENALAHEHVVETIMRTQTIIPMSFGTVFRTEDDIRAVLKSIHASLQEVLAKMADKIELGLKVSWDKEKMIARLRKENEDIRTFESELAKKRLQSTYFARMQLGRMVDQALGERATEILKEIYERLRPACIASRDNRPIGDKMIMNAAFLLQRSKEADFDKIVNQISDKFRDILAFRYSGPWPPYNFVNIRLKLERAQAS